MNNKQIRHCTCEGIISYVKIKATTRTSFFYCMRTRFIIQIISLLNTNSQVVCLGKGISAVRGFGLFVQFPPVVPAFRCNAAARICSIYAAIRQPVTGNTSTKQEVITYAFMNILCTNIASLEHV